MVFSWAFKWQSNPPSINRVPRGGLCLRVWHCGPVRRRTCSGSSDTRGPVTQPHFPHRHFPLKREAGGGAGGPLAQGPAGPLLRSPSPSDHPGLLGPHLHHMSGAGWPRSPRQAKKILESTEPPPPAGGVDDFEIQRNLLNLQETEARGRENWPRVIQSGNSQDGSPHAHAPSFSISPSCFPVSPGSP